MPPPRKGPDRVAPVLGVHVATVRAWLVADWEAPRKQRHTARRVWQRLIEEEGAVVAESSVRAMVRDLRTELGLVGTEVIGFRGCYIAGFVRGDLTALQNAPNARADINPRVGIGEPFGVTRRHITLFQIKSLAGLVSNKRLSYPPLHGASQAQAGSTVCRPPSGSRATSVVRGWNDRHQFGLRTSQRNAFIHRTRRISAWRHSDSTRRFSADFCTQYHHRHAAKL